MSTADIVVEPKSSMEKRNIEKPQEIDENEDNFPTDWRKIFLIMTALYLSMFLVALVNDSLSKLDCTADSLGSNNSRNCHSKHHRRLSLYRWCWLVRQCLSPYFMCLSAYVRSHLHILFCQMGLTICDLRFWNWGTLSFYFFNSPSIATLFDECFPRCLFAWILYSMLYWYFHSQLCVVQHRTRRHSLLVERSACSYDLFANEILTNTEYSWIRKRRDSQRCN